jgi:CRP-like cAMP-binding protein
MKSSNLKYILRHVVGDFFILMNYFLLISHIIACFFILTEKLAKSEVGLDNDPFDWYISVLYFMVTTATTVGYGDITIDHQTQRFIFLRYGYQVFLMVFSLFASSCFFSLVQTTVKDAFYILNRMGEPVNEYEMWLNNRIQKMPRIIEVDTFYRLCITNYGFNYNYSVKIWIWFNDFMDKLSDDWRETIKHKACCDLMVKFTSFFEPLPESLDHELVFGMQPRTFLKGDLIVQRREPFPGIYFIIDGEVRVFFRSKANTVYFYTNGDDIGDQCLLGKHSHFSYACESDVLAMFLPCSCLTTALADYPIYAHFLKRRAAMRQTKLRNVKARTLILRHKLNAAKRREGLALQQPLDKRAILQMQAPARGAVVLKEPLVLGVGDEGKEITSEDSSSSEKNQSGKSISSDENKNESKIQANINPISIAKIKKNKIITKKKFPDFNQVVPFSHAKSNQMIQGLFVDKHLDVGSLVDKELNHLSKDHNQINQRNSETSPFNRLKAAMESVSSSAQTKLLRSNSIDEEARSQAQEKHEFITKILNASVKQEDGIQQLKRQNLASQLQKELILASSKTMAKERVRDFALSLQRPR